MIQVGSMFIQCCYIEWTLIRRWFKSCAFTGILKRVCDSRLNKYYLMKNYEVTVTIFEHGILLFMIFGLCKLRNYYNRDDYLSFGGESVRFFFEGL